MIEKLRWMTWSVLPLVYEESLSYVELLNKVVAKLNEVIEATNDFSGDVKEAVNEWLANNGEKVVEEAVNEAVQSYMQTGDFKKILVDALSTQSDTITEAAAEAAAAWLNDTTGQDVIKTEVDAAFNNYVKSDDFAKLVESFVTDLDDIKRGQSLDIKQIKEFDVYSGGIELHSAEISSDYSVNKDNASIRMAGTIMADIAGNTKFIIARDKTQAHTEVGMNSYKITDVGTPVDDSDAATKKYVDDAIKEGGGQTGTGYVQYVNCYEVSNMNYTTNRDYVWIKKQLDAGGSVVLKVNNTMATFRGYAGNDKTLVFTSSANYPANQAQSTGNANTEFIAGLTVKITSTNAVTVMYSTLNTHDYISADGTTEFTSEQSMGNNRLSNVAAPLYNQDAANKLYVDEAIGSSGLGKLRISDLTSKGDVAKYNNLWTGTLNYRMLCDEENSYGYTGAVLEFAKGVIKATKAFKSMVESKDEPSGVMLELDYCDSIGDRTVKYLNTCGSYNYVINNGDDYSMSFTGKGRQSWAQSNEISSATGKLPSACTFSDFCISTYIDESTNNRVYKFTCNISDPDYSLLSLDNVNFVMAEGITMSYPDGVLVASADGAKLDSNFSCRTSAPNIMLIPVNIQSGNELHKCTFVANGINDNIVSGDIVDNTKLRYVVSYPAANSKEVVFNTTICSNDTDLLAAPLEVNTYASGVGDRLTGTIAFVGEGDNITANISVDNDDGVYNSIYYWFDHWGLDSPLTLSSKNAKYVFNIKRAYKYSTIDTDTMYLICYQYFSEGTVIDLQITFDSTGTVATTYNTIVGFIGGASETVYPVAFNQQTISGTTQKILDFTGYDPKSVYLDYSFTNDVAATLNCTMWVSIDGGEPFAKYSYKVIWDGSSITKGERNLFEIVRNYGTSNLGIRIDHSDSGDVSATSDLKLTKFVFNMAAAGTSAKVIATVYPK